MGLSQLPVDPVTIVDWAPFTPTLTQSGAVTKTINYAEHQRIGGLITAQVNLAVTGTGTGANSVVVGLPVEPHANLTGGTVIGMGWIFDSSLSALHHGSMELVTAGTPTARFRILNSTGFLGSTNFTAALASGDLITYHVAYRGV